MVLRDLHLFTLAFSVAASIIVGSALEARQAAAQSVQYRSPEGVEYRSLPDTDAVKTARAAVAADPKMAEAHYWLGMANVNQGKLPEAVKSFEEYLKLDPSGQYAEQAKGMLSAIKK